MASQYLNFEEYSKNDKQYFMRSLKGELHRIQKKIEFGDGTTYHVTKSGSRYWQKGNYMHRETGPASVWSKDHPGSYYLYGVGFKSREEYEIALNRLHFLREQTQNQVDSLVEEIAKNVAWEKRQFLWQSILCGSKDSTKMIEALQKVSVQYKKLSKMSDKFIIDFS